MSKERLSAWAEEQLRTNAEVNPSSQTIAKPNVGRSLSMGVVEALKDINCDLRLTNHNRWMVWNDTSKEWEIYELKRGAYKANLIQNTRDEGLAVNWLLSE
jgi:hypothetical protein